MHSDGDDPSFLNKAAFDSENEIDFESGNMNADDAIS